MGLKPSNRNILGDAIDFYTNDNEIGSVEEIDINLLVPFKNHPFQLYEGERLNDMVESIKENGILTPVIVRKLKNEYEILAGHNRTNAAKIAGLKKVPCIVKEKLSDKDAYVYVIETNLMQRSFNDLRMSEKALVLAERYDNIKSQGKRNDIIRELKILNGEKLTEEEEKQENVSNRENVAKEYGLSGPTMARLLRVNYLPDKFKALLDNGKIPLLSAVNLSYIDKDALEVIYDIHCDYGIKITEPLSRELRENKNNSKDAIEKIMIKPKSSVSYQSVKLPTNTYNCYFKNKKPKEIENILSKALEMYFEHNS